MLCKILKDEKIKLMAVFRKIQMYGKVTIIKNVQQGDYN